MIVHWRLNPLNIRYFNFRIFTTLLTYLFITLGFTGFSYLAVRSNQVKRKLFTLFGKSYLHENYPKIINNPEDCIDAVKELRKKCVKTRVLGMDCEWRSDTRSAYSRVALLQLASIDGYCSLFRLSNMGHVPDCLSELLSDNSILKVGVAVTNDARKLLKDFGVQCNGCVDVRYMAKHVGLTALGLGKMSHLYLRVELDKSWKIRCSNWEAEVLSEKQIDYAAQDAIASVQLYGYFNKKYISETYPWWKRWFNTGKSIDDDTNSFWFKYADIGFSEKSYSWHNNANDINLKKQKVLSRNSTSDPRNVKNYSTWVQTARKSPLYRNIFIQAPDGMVLCTCDQKKADWYLNKGIAKVVCENPLTLRLTFEPSGRKGGGEGYCAKIKNNQCVVCGGTKLMRRKNIVPHEYRKYFPVEIKGHSSHDVLLLCNFCHSKTQFFDQQLRLQLANECNAPLGNSAGNIRLLNIPELRQVKSAARALLNNGHLIPEERRKELKSVLLSYLDKERTYNSETKLADDGDDDDFDDTVIIDIDSSEILDTATLERLSNVSIRVENEEYRPHGLRVVEHYKNKCENQLDGVYLLEQTWRNHFINSMAPKYLPELWSVNYSHNNRDE